jgi:hypothetical protein
MRFAVRLFAALSALFPLVLSAQFTISGVTDRTMYNNTVTLTVNPQAGYTHNATLNWKPVAIGSPVLVNKPDFYELRVDATNNITSAVTSQYLRFVVIATERGTTEVGIPPHVPFPAIQSSSNEFAGAQLRMIVPSAWPASNAVPVVAWVMDADNHPVRANGMLLLAGNEPQFQIRRGVGSGFIDAGKTFDTVNYVVSVGGAQTNIHIDIETNITWTTVSGVLNGNTVWPEHSRIQVTAGITIPNGSTLTIGEGSIVRLNSRVDITNNGTVTVNGTLTNPVVFLPATNGQPWGGFVMRNASQGIVNATATIFTGAGAEPNWFGANGNPGSHRTEQSLFYCDGGQQLNLTDSAAMYYNGQLGHSRVNSPATPIRLTRFLMQRLTTGGEYTGANFTVNDSAFIECPDDTVNFVDGDNDGLYIIGGVHAFTNTLFGWTKDDGIDSGGTDASGNHARLTYESCWFESTFHEGNSLSGYKTIFSHNTVYFDCGQGIEDGYNAPTGRLDSCFFTMCKSGVRHGDNYTSIGNYDGRFLATNCITIYNHRDLFGFNWGNSGGGWTNSYDRFWPSNNWVSVLDTNYPNNMLWDPANDGWRLAAVGGVGHVGVGFGARGTSLSQFPDGIPVGLSRHCTNEVRVDYEVDGIDGTHASGTLVFPAGLTRRFLPTPTNLNGVLRVALLNPQNADVTGNDKLLFQNLAGESGGTVVLSPFGANWRYLDDGSNQGTAWRAPNFDDNSWGNGPSRLGFGPDALPLATTIRRFVQTNGVDTARQITNFYFRRAIVVTNPTSFATIQFRYQRDDGCVVYVNGNQVFTNNMGLPPYTANTFAPTTISGAPALMTFWTNTISATNLVAGTNVIAVEVHQSTSTSSDIAWHMELVGIPPSSGARLYFSKLGADGVLYWSDSTFGLQEADVVTGPWRWTNPTNSPFAAPMEDTRFFRLKK